MHFPHGRNQLHCNSTINSNPEKPIEIPNPIISLIVDKERSSDEIFSTNFPSSTLSIVSEHKNLVDYFEEDVTTLSSEAADLFEEAFSTESFSTVNTTPSPVIEKSLAKLKRHQKIYKKLSNNL